MPNGASSSIHFFSVVMIRGLNSPPGDFQRFKLSSMEGTPSRRAPARVEPGHDVLDVGLEHRDVA